LSLENIITCHCSTIIDVITSASEVIRHAGAIQIRLLLLLLLLFVDDCSPSGWDSEKKISILYEGLNSMRHDDAYNDVITRPVTRKVKIDHS